MSNEPIYKRRLREYRKAKSKSRVNATLPVSAPTPTPRSPLSDNTTDSTYSKPLRRGDPIPGSILYRDFCRECGEPMRVDRTTARKKHSPCCERCEPHQLANMPATTDDLSPWQENAIRAMEDR